MSREGRRVLSAGCAWGAALMLHGTSARAHGGAGDEAERPVPQAPAAVAPSGENAAPEGEGRRPEREPKAMVALDMVLGWGRVPFAVQNLPQPGQPAVTYTRSDGVSSNVQSIVMAGSMGVVEHVGVGARLPLTFAGFSPNGTAGRSTTSFGNLELEGEYTQHLAPRLRLIGSLGLALPTAQGTELPEDLNQTPAQQVDTTSYDRYSLNRAAAAARGFEPNRLGVVPKLALVYSLHGVSIEPYVKVENLIGTSTDLAAPYVGEVVAAARVGYWVQRLFELSLKGLANVGFAGTEDDKKVAVALEPDVVLRFGPVRPYAGVIVPVAGPPSENGFVGVHFGVALAL
jgi:hypothetical protein